jgi:hypothetical protein
MKELVENFKNLEVAVSKERGPFSLFGLFAREDLPDRWDLIVSAPWAANPREATEFLVDEIKKQIGPQKLSNLSRIVIVPYGDAAVGAMNQAMHIEHGSAEVSDSNFFGLAIKKAYIITSQRLDPQPSR